ncbi:MAG: hypothetical protein HYW51_02130 [Candidatus Doudnabacteria bacterium]|nr:hypothetical protein [Candidatus Doudnabacteria bacterium]
MWYSGNDFTNEELEVLKELERELFKYNPGFRAMWHDDFEEYFKGTLNEEYWERREKQRNKELEEIVRKRMVEDFEYVKFRHELAEIEEMLSRDDLFSIKARAGFEDEWEKAQEKKREDKLYVTAKDWSFELSHLAYELYETYKLLPLFRIGKNASYVAAKIAYASADFRERIETLEDLARNTSWIGYTLALTFLNRSLESLEKLERENELAVRIDLDRFQTTGSKMKLELMDRLEKFHQSALKARFTGSNSRE